MKTYTKYTALTTTTLLAVVLAGPAIAAPQEEALEVSQTSNTSKTVQESIAVPAVELPEENSPSVATEAYQAPVLAPEPAPATDLQTQLTTPVNVPVPAKTTPTPAPAPVAPKAPAAPAPVADTPASGNGAAIAAAAVAQVGVAQDCTKLVTNALARATGINHHGWPISYMALGKVVTEPQAGDLIYYTNAGAGVPHIAVYIGGGKAVHGGWYGSTSIQSAYLGSGPVFIRVA